jgi:hypothetical protein
MNNQVVVVAKKKLKQLIRHLLCVKGKEKIPFF